MIVETVTFKIRPGMTRDEVLESSRATIDRWQGFPGLERKIYAMVDDQTAMGIYLWQSREHAEVGHDEAWINNAEKFWGDRPRFAYFDTLMILDNRHDEILEYPKD